MLRNLYLGFFFFWIIGFCFSQTSTNSFIDEFNEDSEWPLFDDEDAAGSLKNGKYLLKSKLKDGEALSCCYPFIDWKKDFSIELSYDQLTKDFKNISGLVWCKSEAGYNGFFIRPNGWYTIVVKYDNAIKPVKEWTKLPEINNIGVNNNLKISKKASQYIFYINDKEVYSTQENNFIVGNNGVGFVVQGLNELEVENFKFTQDVKIKLTNDALIKREKINLGANINTKYTEIGPVISSDGKTIYYIIEDSPLNTGGSGQDIWMSKMLPDSTWSKAVNLGKPINNIETNGVISISPDNNTLYLSGLYNKDGSFAGMGFSSSERLSTGWSVPERIKIKNFYNKSTFQEACFGPDKKTMVFTAQRNDSYGQNTNDLYVSFRERKNEWSEPFNLGGIVNSTLDEASPYLAADNKTLYFSSNGRPGYGDMDVFVTKRLDESWTKWSEPLNLGPYINSLEFDAYFSITAKGDYAYMVTAHKSIGDEDIVKVKMPENARPDPVVVVYGKVYDSKTKKIISADLTYEQLLEGKELGTASSDPNTGDYRIIVPFGKKYGVYANKDGYFPQHENIDVSKVHSYKEIEINVYLVPIEVGEKVALNNVFFEQSKAVLLPESYPELDRMIALLKKKPALEIELAGHTDNQGEPDKNLILSEERVEAIKKYCISKGINAKRITGKGYGQTQPIASNAKEETRKLNRRVEFRITKK